MAKGYSHTPATIDFALLTLAYYNISLQKKYIYIRILKIIYTHQKKSILAKDSILNKFMRKVKLR